MRCINVFSITKPFDLPAGRRSTSSDQYLKRSVWQVIHRKKLGLKKALFIQFVFRKVKDQSLIKWENLYGVLCLVCFQHGSSFSSACLRQDSFEKSAILDFGWFELPPFYFISWSLVDLHFHVYFPHGFFRIQRRFRNTTDPF